jgi:hypothetical protein
LTQSQSCCTANAATTNARGLIIDLFFDDGDATGIASTRDIDIGGLYMNTKAVLPEGARLMLRIPSVNGPILVNACVIYSNPERGVGARFDRLSGKEHAAIERISMEALV